MAGAEPNGMGNVVRNPVFVRVAGVLFFAEFPFEQRWRTDERRGRNGMQADTLWEIRLILDIKFAPNPKP